jgi:polysaccharide export outer membrane protein
VKYTAYLTLFLLLLFFSACKTFNPNVMFETDKHFELTELNTFEPADYKIAIGDQLELNVFTNNGYKLVDALVTGTDPQKVVSSQLIYNINVDGTAKFPMIGAVVLLGKTIRGAEEELETLFAAHFKEPFVKVKVINRRVSVFRGNEEAVVVDLESENMTLIEVLAAAGGIPETGKAHKIKLIRGDYQNPQVSVIDLSTIEGMSQANLIVQANDIIYIKSTINTGFFREIATVIGAATSVFVIYQFFSTR